MPERLRYIEVKNFRTFQHYSDRDTPPWIKLYNRLLDDYGYVRLGEGARSQLIGIWLLASRHGNAVPYDDAYLREALHVRRLYVDELVGAGFVQILSDKPARDASTALATGYHDASRALANTQHDASPSRARARARPRGRERREEERREEEMRASARDTAPSRASDQPPTENGKRPAPYEVIAAEKDEAKRRAVAVSHIKAIVAASPGHVPQQFPSEAWAMFSTYERNVISESGGLVAVWEL